MSEDKSCFFHIRILLYALAHELKLAITRSRGTTPSSSCPFSRLMKHYEIIKGTAASQFCALFVHIPSGLVSFKHFDVML